jgi:choline kinase
VLLAAGAGRRLNGQVKALYPLNGIPLMHRAVLVLAALGFDRLLIVTGYGSESLHEYWARHPAPVEVSWLHNDQWKALNNFHTVALACEHADDGDLLILNSDVVFTGEVLVSLSGARETLTLAVDDSAVDAEAMGVAIVDGRVADLGKHLTDESAAGEFIGASVLKAEGRARYLAESAHASNEQESTLYYEDIYARIGKSERVGVARVSELWWAEIDAPADVARATRVAARQDCAVGVEAPRPRWGD